MSSAAVVIGALKVKRIISSYKVEKQKKGRKLSVTRILDIRRKHNNNNNNNNKNMRSNVEKNETKIQVLKKLNAYN